MDAYFLYNLSFLLSIMHHESGHFTQPIGLLNHFFAGMHIFYMHILETSINLIDITV